MSKEYREGNDEAMPTVDEVVERRLQAMEDVPEEVEEKVEEEKPDYETAFLFVRHLDGALEVVTELSNLKLGHEASPGEVHQMVTELLESIRVGRVATAVQATLLPQINQLNRQLLLGAKGGFRKGPTKK